MISLMKAAVSLVNVKSFHTSTKLLWHTSKYAELDVDYICNPKNIAAIQSNITKRKGVGDVQLVIDLKTQLDQASKCTNRYEQLSKKFKEELLRIPNRTHPEVFTYGEEPKVVKLVNKKREFSFQPKEFYEIAKKNNLARTEHLGHVCGNRSYFILGELAELEQAIVNYFLETLLKCDFQLISVPDILPRDVIESCGMSTRGPRNQVYTLDPALHKPDMCLSGTSEMALAAYLCNKVFTENELPRKMVAVSRCYRAETSSIAEERGIFRVHEFTKVEMFLVTTPETSDAFLGEIRAIQERNFQSLGLHYQVLDMPPHELGAPAYRKYDVEAWMPGRGMYGEISSSSNCTDYQSRRLGIKYKKHDGTTDFVHTLNGTACAIPRLLIALTETGQDDKGFIHIPEVLQKYMRHKTVIGRQKKIPDLRLVKNKKSNLSG